MATTHWTHGGLDVAAPAGAATTRDGRRGSSPRSMGTRTRIVARGCRAGGGGPRRATRGRGHRSRRHPGRRARRDPDRDRRAPPRRAAPGRAGGGASSRGGTRAFCSSAFGRYRDAWPAYAARNLAAAAVAGRPARDPRGRGRPRRTRGPPQPQRALAGRALRRRRLARRARLPRSRGRSPPVPGASACPRSSASVTTVPRSTMPASALGTRRLRDPEPAALGPGPAPVRGAPRRHRRGRRPDPDRLRRRRRRAQRQPRDRDPAPRQPRAPCAWRPTHSSSPPVASAGAASARTREASFTSASSASPVEAPPRDAWFSDDPLLPHPIEAAGIRTDADLRPIGAPGSRARERASSSAPRWPACATSTSDAATAWRWPPRIGRRAPSRSGRAAA